MGCEHHGGNLLRGECRKGWGCRLPRNRHALAKQLFPRGKDGKPRGQCPFLRNGIRPRAQPGSDPFATQRALTPKPATASAQS
ncbi:hypothetical protein STRNTR1_1739 [Stenotrophomonas maltophilia]|nr:hypothetical protein STRNTR1_1739 [Stenotrophomonas maltophilia]